MVANEVSNSEAEDMHMGIPDYIAARYRIADMVARSLRYDLNWPEHAVLVVYDSLLDGLEFPNGGSRNSEETLESILLDIEERRSNYE